MALMDYTDIVNDIDESKDPETIKAGTEIKARIISVNTGTSEKNGCDWFMPVFDVPEMPAAKEFRDFFWILSKENLEPKDATKVLDNEASVKEALAKKDYARSLNKFRNFAKAMGLDYTRPFDLDDLVGLEGWLIVGLRKDPEYGEQNTVERYIIPR